MQHYLKTPVDLNWKNNNLTWTQAYSIKYIQLVEIYPKEIKITLQIAFTIPQK